MTSDDFATGMNAAVIARALAAAPEDRDRVSAMMVKLAKLEARIKETDASILQRTADVSERQKNQEDMYASFVTQNGHSKLLSLDWSKILDSDRISASVAESRAIGDEIKAINAVKASVDLLCREHSELMKELAKVDSPIGSINVDIKTDADGHFVPVRVAFELNA